MALDMIASSRTCKVRRASHIVGQFGAAIALGAFLWGYPGVARATDPFNSKDATSSSSHASDTGGHTQFNLAPVVGGTTDIGFGVGEFSGAVRVKKGYDPYVWNIESAGLVTFKDGGTGIVVPYQDLYVKLTVPRFLTSRTRVEVRPSYTSESTLNYDGMGNASSDVRPARTGDSYAQYGRIHPALSVDVRSRLVDHVATRAGVRYTQNWVHVDAQSRLADDLRSGSAEVKSLLGSTRAHGVALFTYGLQWDDRDNEISTHTGSFDEVLVALSPGGVEPVPYRYGQVNLTSRLFLPIGSRRFTLALRGVADILFGSPPFYELSRYDDTYALGGANGVRGVPGQRYYGKVKVFGNVEIRADVVSFHALGRPLALGLVTFVDGGRVWADTTSHPELDGNRLGMKYGVGGGVRLQSGDAFVLRADLAWSPDAQPIGGYVAAGQTF
jgi:outer membrane protein assembly factor BamA